MRDGVRAEGIQGGYGAVYGELRALETLGLCRRGYFVEGLGGAQFALPGAVERLRAQREAEEQAPVVLAATDPAQPFGATVPWPDALRKLARVAGAWVVLVGGRLALYVERGGKGLGVLVDEHDARIAPALEALADFVRAGRIKKLDLEKVDGENVVGSDLEPLLVELGFRVSPRRLTLTA